MATRDVHGGQAYEAGQALSIPVGEKIVNIYKQTSAISSTIIEKTTTTDEGKIAEPKWRQRDFGRDYWVN